MKKDIVFEDIKIIDWYDGLVQGIAKSSNQSYLIFLMKWNMKLDTKQFGLIELTPAEVAEIEKCFEDSKNPKDKNWKCYQNTYENIVKTYKGDFYLSTHYPEINQDYQIEAADFAEYHSKFLDHDIEKVII
jgi:hypothetical protein